jgi:hypothetical protein
MKHNILPSKFDSPKLPEGTYEYDEYSPANNPQSPPYSTVSPAYVPSSPDVNSTSPAYVPSSSDVNSTSPAYVPSSPVNKWVPYEGERLEQAMREWEDSRKYYDPKTQSMTHHWDETIKAWVKNQTYEEMWNIKGGDHTFSVGEHVFLRGGKNVKKPWTVKNVGHKFITIYNEDPNINDDEDDILVVSRHELMKPNEIPSINYHNEHDGMFDKPIIRNISSPSEEHRKDGIIFAPNIVVNTGNDNKIGTNGVPSEDVEDSSLNQNPIINKTGGFTMSPPESSSKTIVDKEDTPVKESSSSLTNGGFGILDFAKNLIIKKTS